MLRTRTRRIPYLAMTTALAGAIILATSATASAAGGQTNCPQCQAAAGYYYPQPQPVHHGQVQTVPPGQAGYSYRSVPYVQPTRPTWFGGAGGPVQYQRGYRGMATWPGYGMRPGYVRVPGETFSGQYGNTFGLGWSPAMGMGVPSGPPGTGIGLPSMGR